MTSPIPTRFSDDELAGIDWLVTTGVGKNRSDVIRKAVARLDESVRRERVGQTIAASYRLRPQTFEDDQLAAANALAMTEAEPW
jgi:Arc/MetJ-type ribon-helix-helix transcriptional regulator